MFEAATGTASLEASLDTALNFISKLDWDLVGKDENQWFISCTFHTNSIALIDY